MKNDNKQGNMPTVRHTSTTFVTCDEPMVGQITIEEYIKQSKGEDKNEYDNLTRKINSRSNDNTSR